MLASTVQFSSYGRSHRLPRPTNTTGWRFTQESKWPVQSEAHPCGRFPQDPTVCLASPPSTPVMFHHPYGAGTDTNHRQRALRQCSTLEQPSTRAFGGHHGLCTTSHQGRLRAMLLRKEVIQPHLPVRLPCYDLVPIASPTFDGSLPRVGPPASGVTDFRDLTGGVYTARERIHRSVADLRLLATPTSWGRVADPNPN